MKATKGRYDHLHRMFALLTLTLLLVVCISSIKVGVSGTALVVRATLVVVVTKFLGSFVIRLIRSIEETQGGETKKGRS